MLAVALGAAPEGIVFSDVAVTVKMQTAPSAEFKTKGGVPDENPAPVNRDWAMIAVSFRPGVGKAGHGAKALRGAWIDDPVLDVTVEIPYGETFKGKKKSALLTGQTRFWSIPLDGKVHTALMCVPPRLLDRYLAVRGKGEVKASETMFRVQALLHGSDGAVLGEGYFNVEGKEREQQVYFARLAGSETFKDAVFPRDRTPWALQNPDQYDFLKE